MERGSTNMEKAFFLGSAIVAAYLGTAALVKIVQALNWPLWLFVVLASGYLALIWWLVVKGERGLGK